MLHSSASNAARDLRAITASISTTRGACVKHAATTARGAALELAAARQVCLRPPVGAAVRTLIDRFV